MQLALIAKANPVEHVLLDWTLPWWAGIVVYVVVGVGWLLCFYTTILYGVKFTDDEVCSPRALTRPRPIDPCMHDGISTDPRHLHVLGRALSTPFSPFTPSLPCHYRPMHG